MIRPTELNGALAHYAALRPAPAARLAARPPTPPPCTTRCTSTGHTFQLGPAGPREDTVIVRPGQQIACDLDASNPGQWMTYCHNLYHAPQAGMMAMLSYQA
jgi:FtsP/CotA-like multicopper oxidase with cupredoxin domain